MTGRIEELAGKYITKARAVMPRASGIVQWREALYLACADLERCQEMNRMAVARSGILTHGLAEEKGASE